MERDIKFKIGGSGEGQCIRTLLKILDQNCTYQEDPKLNSISMAATTRRNTGVGISVLISERTLIIQHMTNSNSDHCISSSIQPPATASARCFSFSFLFFWSSKLGFHRVLFSTNTSKPYGPYRSEKRQFLQDEVYMNDSWSP